MRLLYFLSILAVLQLTCGAVDTNTAAVLPVSNASSIPPTSTAHNSTQNTSSSSTTTKSSIPSTSTLATPTLPTSPAINLTKSENGSAKSDVTTEHSGVLNKNGSETASLNVTSPTSAININTTGALNTTAAPNTTAASNTTTPTSSEEAVTAGEPVLPEKSSAEEERNSSISIFFVLCVLALGILLIHLMLLTHFQYLPESITIVCLGGLIGLVLNMMSNQNIANWRKEEAFSPTAFFLVLLPPIIFESGYNLHKGNFFQNIGSILVFAIVGTAISALVIGSGIYVLGLAGMAYSLSFVESFAFGSLISAVDPVATVAIFHALDIDPVLNMLVFGESILNDAIAIVLTTSILRSNSPGMSAGEAVLNGISQFFSTFFASAGIGVLFALTSALLLKYVDLRKHPSLEFAMMLVFTYAPYALAEGIHLSGTYERALWLL